MEILINGKSKAYSRLPFWLESVARRLSSLKQKNVVIISRSDHSSQGNYTLYCHRNKTIVKITGSKDLPCVSVYHQDLPNGEPKLPEWRLCEKKTCLNQIELADHVYGVAVNHLSRENQYSTLTVRRTLVQSYPGQDNPVYGGQISESESSGDFYRISTVFGQVVYLPRTEVDKYKKIIGHFIVMKNNNDFSIVKPEVFFDYFELI